MNERKYYSHEEKVKIVLEGLSGTIQISELCRKYDNKPARFYNWKEKLLKNSPSIFDDRGRKNTSSEKEERGTSGCNYQTQGHDSRNNNREP